MTSTYSEMLVDQPVLEGVIDPLAFVLPDNQILCKKSDH
jgi:hypothetical protein